MTEILTFSAEQAAPARADVLKNQAIPPDKPLSPAIEALCARALGLLADLGAPAGVLREIPPAGFAVVYYGEGRNEPRTPVGEIFERADHLALFALTLGQRVSRDITQRFRSGDMALAAMLDSAASAAVDKLAELAQVRFSEYLSPKPRSTHDTTVLSYSPGYCGWHITGQKKLFEFLHPGQIGISLTGSFLMEPLKSVSGVLIAAPKELHSLPDSYPFCRRCKMHSCRARLRALPAQ